MSEEEKTHAQLIEDIIGRKLKPFMILISIVVAIFGIIAVPIAAQVISLTKDQGIFEGKMIEKINSDEVYRNFVTKGAYHIMQKDEHIADLDAIKNPGNAEIIYMKHNADEAEGLELRTRGAYYKDQEPFKSEKN
jgi:hypothetical protein